MSIWKIILTGTALAMDALAITIANCTTHDNLSKKKEWAMPILFAFFQSLMPLIGFFAGKLVADFIGAFAGYITTGVFFILGIKVIVDIIKPSEEEKKKDLTFIVLVLQAIATSIDALVVGFTFGAQNVNIYIAVLIIFVTTFIIITLGVLLGKLLSNKLGNYAQMLGAVILLTIAVETLIETLI